jgi:DNA-binding MurR/RpiR family transcriptional regulator
LSVGLARLEAAQRGETLFVVAEDSAPVPLLERVNDARHVGATILALDEGDPELDALANEALAVPESLSFDAGQHLVSAAAGERDAAVTGATRGRSLRERLARLLDTVTGPTGGGAPGGWA